MWFQNTKMKSSYYCFYIQTEYYFKCSAVHGYIPTSCFQMDKPGATCATCWRVRPTGHTPTHMDSCFCHLDRHCIDSRFSLETCRPTLNHTVAGGSYVFVRHTFDSYNTFINHLPTNKWPKTPHSTVFFSAQHHYLPIFSGYIQGFIRAFTIAFVSKIFCATTWGLVD